MQYTLLPRSINQPNYPVSDSEGNEEDDGQEIYDILEARFDVKFDALLPY